MTAAGFQVDAIDLAGDVAVGPGASADVLEAALDAVDDGACLARVGAVAGDVSVVGLGLGATVALMAASALGGFRSVVALSPRLVVPTLSSRHPAQPLDLLLGLRVPVQVHVGDRDPHVRPAHTDSLRDRLDAQGIGFQVLEVPAGRGFWDATSTDFDAAEARTAWARAVTFLRRTSA